MSHAGMWKARLTPQMGLAVLEPLLAPLALRAAALSPALAVQVPSRALRGVADPEPGRAEPGRDEPVSDAPSLMEQRAVLRALSLIVSASLDGLR